MRFREGFEVSVCPLRTNQPVLARLLYGCSTVVGSHGSRGEAHGREHYGFSTTLGFSLKPLVLIAPMTMPSANPENPKMKDRMPSSLSGPRCGAPSGRMGAASVQGPARSRRCHYSAASCPLLPNGGPTSPTGRPAPLARRSPEGGSCWEPSRMEVWKNILGLQGY